MSESLKQRINEMKQLAEALHNNRGTWETYSGYSISENDPFINLTEEELQYA